MDFLLRRWEEFVNGNFRFRFRFSFLFSNIVEMNLRFEMIKQFNGSLACLLFHDTDRIDLNIKSYRFAILNGSGKLAEKDKVASSFAALKSVTSLLPQIETINGIVFCSFINVQNIYLTF